MATMMKAVVVRPFGEPLAIEEVPIPHLHEGHLDDINRVLPS